MFFKVFSYYCYFSSVRRLAIKCFWSSKFISNRSIFFFPLSPILRTIGLCCVACSWLRTHTLTSEGRNSAPKQFARGPSFRLVYMETDSTKKYFKLFSIKHVTSVNLHEIYKLAFRFSNGDADKLYNDQSFINKRLLIVLWHDHEWL